MKTTYVGLAAESAVADFLVSKGYKVTETNFRTRVCEIDIVATKDKIVCFVEVKYRGSDRQGGGLEYITPKKLRQLNFAAEIWIQQHNWDGDWRLMAASVGQLDQAFKLEEIVEIT